MALAEHPKGACRDFIVWDEKMHLVANWIIASLPFDRLDFYGSARPIHLSFAASELREVIERRTDLLCRLVLRHDR